MVDWKQRLLALAPEVEERLPALYSAIVKKAPTVEGEVVGDIAKQATTRVLPDVETTATQRLAPLMIEQAAEEAAPAVAAQASKLPGQLLGATGLGASAYVASKLFGEPERTEYVSAPVPPQKQAAPQDTSNMVGAEDTETEGELEYDPNDSIQNPMAKTDEKSASEYLALSKGQTPSAEETAQAPQVSTERAPASTFEQQLEGAREQDKQRNLMMGLLKAAQMGGAALAGTKADTSFADTELADKNREATRLKTTMDMLEENANIQQKQRKRDPKSAVSTASRDLLQKMGMKVSPDMSAEDIEKVLPQFTSYFNHLDAIEAKKELAREKDLDRKAAADLKKQETQDTKITDRLTKLNKDMTEEVASGRSAFGTAAKNLQAISNAKALLAGQDPDSIDNRQIAEVARVLDRTLSGGTPTISGTAHLTPETARMKIAEFLEKYTNKVQGAGAGDFMRKYQHTLDREEQQAKTQIRNTQGKFLASVSDIAKTNPDRLSAILEAHGLKGQFNEKGIFIPEGVSEEKSTTIPRQQVSTDKTVQPKGTVTKKALSDYATKHNKSIEEAAELLTKAGYNVQR